MANHEGKPIADVPDAESSETVKPEQEQRSEAEIKAEEENRERAKRLAADPLRRTLKRYYDQEVAKGDKGSEKYRRAYEEAAAENGKLIRYTLDLSGIYGGRNSAKPREYTTHADLIEDISKLPESVQDAIFASGNRITANAPQKIKSALDKNSQRRFEITRNRFITAPWDVEEGESLPSIVAIARKVRVNHLAGKIRQLDKISRPSAAQRVELDEAISLLQEEIEKLERKAPKPPAQLVPKPVPTPIPSLVRKSGREAVEDVSAWQDGNIIEDALGGARAVLNRLFRRRAAAPAPAVVSAPEQAPALPPTPAEKPEAVPVSPETILADSRKAYAQSDSRLQNFRSYFSRKNTSMDKVVDAIRAEYRQEDRDTDPRDLVERISSTLKAKDVLGNLDLTDPILEIVAETVQKKIAYEDTRNAISETLLEKKSLEIKALYAQQLGRPESDWTDTERNRIKQDIAANRGVDFFKTVIQNEHDLLETERLASLPPSVRERMTSLFRGSMSWWLKQDPVKRTILMSLVAGIVAAPVSAQAAGIAVGRRLAAGTFGPMAAAAVGKGVERFYGESAVNAREKENLDALAAQLNLDLADAEGDAKRINSVLQTIASLYEKDAKKFAKQKKHRALVKAGAMITTGFLTGKTVGWGAQFLEHGWGGGSAVSAIESHSAPAVTAADHAPASKIAAVDHAPTPEQPFRLVPNESPIEAKLPPEMTAAVSAQQAHIESIATVRTGEGAWQAVYRQLQERMGKSPKLDAAIQSETRRILIANNFLNKDGTATNIGIDHPGVKLILDKDNNIQPIEGGAGTTLYNFASRNHGSPTPLEKPVAPATHVQESKISSGETPDAKIVGSAHHTPQESAAAEESARLTAAETTATPKPPAHASLKVLEQSPSKAGFRTEEAIPDSAEEQGKLIAKHMGISSRSYASFEKARIGDFMDKMKGKHVGDTINYRGVSERITQDHIWLNKSFENFEEQGSESVKDGLFGEIFDNSSPLYARQIIGRYEELATGRDSLAAHIIPIDNNVAAQEIITAPKAAPSPAPSPEATPAPKPAPAPSPDRFAPRPEITSESARKFIPDRNSAVAKAVKSYNKEHIPGSVDLSISSEPAQQILRQMDFVTDTHRTIFGHARVGDFVKTITRHENDDFERSPISLTIPDETGDHAPLKISMTREHVWFMHAIRKLDADPGDLSQMTFARLFEKYGDKLIAAYDKIKEGK
jgi:hypothetical protein